MVNVMKGVLVECDPAMKQFLLHMDESEAFGRKFVIQDLDETHLFISADIVPVLQDKIDDWMDKLSFPLAENNMEVPSDTSVMDSPESRGVYRKVADKVLSWCWRVVKRRLKPGAALFVEGDTYCRLSSKYVPVDERDSLDTKRVQQFSCGIAGCTHTFDTLIKYESHYNASHRYVCSTCRRVFPVAHLLDVHILESHDSMFSLLTQTHDMYQCLLADCLSKFRTAEDRRRHMISVHKYPSNYRYDRRKRGKGSRPSKPRPQEAMDTEMAPPVSQDSAPRKFSYKVPNNICFGQGASRGFVRGRGRGRGRSRGRKHWHNMGAGNADTSVNIETVDMAELADALS